MNNNDRALYYLSQINYYRLSAYFLPYQEKEDIFNDNTTFKDIIDTYSFDRELRLLIFDCIERIEIGIRTKFIYEMSLKYDNSHWQDDPNLFANPYKNKIGNLVDTYSNFQSIISRAKTTRRKEVFIKHYLDTYNSPSNPPSWMCFELLTIGDLSYIYKGLRNKSDKKMISDEFDLHQNVFSSWLHTLTYVRNICAHHSRLWNKSLAVKPDILKKPFGPWLSPMYNDNKRMFYFICLLKYFLLRVNKGNKLKEKLDALIKKYPNVPTKFIGIPSDGKGNQLDWQNEPLWQ